MDSEQHQQTRGFGASVENPVPALTGVFPSTRYAGSKRRLLGHLHDVFQGIPFQSALDLFSGTSIVSYLLKKMGKQVFCNDHLWANYWAGMALIENDSVHLSDSDLRFILDERPTHETTGFVAATFRGVYFTDEENEWLDKCRQNISELSEACPSDVRQLKQAMALHPLFQSALRKRPFNMFHRHNLYLRTASVSRGFGNATTWSRPFRDHYVELVRETNSCVFSNGFVHKAYREDAISWCTPPRTDLVYIDPPYVWGGASQAEIDYASKYHFLEGLARYDEWPDLIDRQSPLLQFRDGYRPWPGGSVSQQIRVSEAFATLLEKYGDRTVVLSYRDPGIPPVSELLSLMQQHKRHVYEVRWPYSYALGKHRQTNAPTYEIIIVGSDASYHGPGREVT